MKIFETDKALIIAVITATIGVLWVTKTGWDYEVAIILIAALVEILYYAYKKLQPTPEDEIPNVEMTLTQQRSFRSPPVNIVGVSPVNENGYYTLEIGGTFYSKLIKPIY